MRRFLLHGAIAAVAAVVVLFVATRPAGRVVASWRRPDGAYVLSVVEEETDWKGFPLELGSHYAVQVARSAEAGTYGHSVEHSFSSDIAACTVAWEAAGVTLTEPSGHRLFIPTSSYEGGR